MKIRTKHLTLPKAFFASGMYSGVKKRKVCDLSILYSSKPAVAAGVFTKNKVTAWNVKFCKKIIRQKNHRAIVTSSGNANCVNGPSGKVTVERIANATTRFLEVKPKQVFVCATGIIGKVFPTDRVVKAIPRLVSTLSTKGGHNAALGILTTDKKTKEITVETSIGGKKVTFCAFAKGAGMLHPNMATMLAYVATDAAISKSLLHTALKQAANQSFNKMCVDNDMSTNDTVLVLANGAAENKTITQKGADFKKLYAALEAICIYIAKEMVRDGEGVSHVCEIQVQGAKSEEEAVAAGRALGTSMLFKTMLAGCDPNWGRIIGALGSAPKVTANSENISLWIGEEPVLKKGKHIARFTGRLHRILKQKEYVIRIDLHHGKAKSAFWTSDLTKKYVHINAAYST